MRAWNARSEDQPGRPVRRRDAGTGGRKPDGRSPTLRSPYRPDGAYLIPAAVLGLQRSAGNAVVARILSERQGAVSAAPVPVQRFAICKPGDSQYPVFREEEIEKGRWGRKRSGTKPPEKPEEFFPSQHKNDKGKFTDDSGKVANIEYHDKPPLQISDNFDLAVEYNVEAKYFYATDDHIAEANKKLKGEISFKKGPELLKITLENGKNRELHRVIPWKKEEGRAVEGLAITTPQQCDAMVIKVTGHKGNVVNELGGYDYIALLLDETIRLSTGIQGGWSEELRNKPFTYKGDNAKEDLFRFHDTLVKEFEEQRNSHPDEFQEAIKNLHLNQYARIPSPGDIMATTGKMPTEQRLDKENKGEDFFTYHFGGVVAVSGKDFITMENYSRKKSVAVSSGDPLFFFNMYGPQRTWHDVQQAERGLYGAVVSVMLKA